MAPRPPRRHLPPLNALRAFEAAARLGSLSAAADELCVTHGAVSRQVRLLEDWVGVALDAVAAASNRLREVGRGVRSLTVNALPTFAMRWLLPRLAAFQRGHA